MEEGNEGYTPQFAENPETRRVEGNEKTEFETVEGAKELEYKAAEDKKPVSKTTGEKEPASDTLERIKELEYEATEDKEPESKMTRDKEPVSDTLEGIKESESGKVHGIKEQGELTSVFHYPHEMSIQEFWSSQAKIKKEPSEHGEDVSPPVDNFLVETDDVSMEPRLLEGNMHVAKFVCDNCCVVFDSSSELMHHTETCNPNSCSVTIGYISSEIGTDFVEEHANEEAFSHEEKHSTGMQSKKKGFHGCDVTSSSSYEGRLSSHVRMHRSPKQYSCGICNKIFSDPSNFNRHKKSHKGLKPYVCEICGQRFTRLGSVTRHHVRAHECVEKMVKSEPEAAAGERETICDVCGKEFDEKIDLKRHRKTHLIKQFRCDTCGRRFHLDSGLKAHMKNHDEFKPFNCEVCGRGFTENRFLTRHMKIHEGIKPYVCETCGKGFLRSSCLKAHMTIHDNDRGFSCENCDKKFKQYKSFNKHRKVCKRSDTCT